MTDEDRAWIKEEIRQMKEDIKQEILLLFPETVGRLIELMSAKKEAVQKFYKDNREFIDNQKIVQSVLQQFDADNPGKSWDEIIQLSVPEIKRRISTVGSLNMVDMNKPKDLDFKGSNLGDI